ncbi:hypothetical protein MMC12_000385 [Toensbergia leucococca]|nr:hypothetical protein [Toensbergia leucococca]
MYTNLMMQAISLYALRQLYFTNSFCPGGQVQQLTIRPSSTKILIDVRESSEVASTGRIPTSHNLPIATQPDGFFLPADEFEEKFGFPKPEDGDEVVFYCKAGVRSRAAVGLAREAGWTATVGNYEGSWMDWESKGGKIEKN